MSIDNANDSQRKAIIHYKGPMQVIAGPGSGKTFTIIERLKYLTGFHREDPHKILVITFTKAAAEEMKYRYSNTVGEVSAPGTSNTSITFGTFHSIFYHILRASSASLSLITEQEKTKILHNLLPSITGKETYQKEELALLLAEISRVKNRMDSVDQQESAVLTGDPLHFKLLYEQYREIMSQMGKLDFDDMVLNCYELLSKEGDVVKRWQRQWRFILVDEFQDINLIQYEILKLLAGPENHLFVVGDDDQAIYGFRGATPSIMNTFRKDYPESEQIILNVNYRSSPMIVTAAEKVISFNTHRMEKKMISGKEASDYGAAISIRQFLSREQEYDAVCTLLKRVPAIRHNQYAIITRTNYEQIALARCLEKERIGYRTKERKISLKEHFITQDLLAYIRLSISEKDRASFLQVMNRPFRGLGRNIADGQGFSLNGLLCLQQEGSRIYQELQSLIKDCRRIRELSPYFAVNYIRNKIGYDRYLGEKKGAGNLLPVADRIQESAKSCRSLKEWEEILNRKEDETIRKTPCNKGVFLLTMHASKGLQYPYVILPDLNQGIIPDKKAKTLRTLEEERRLFYVAMTRAQEQLHLFYVCSQHEQPSEFLKPLL